MRRLLIFAAITLLACLSARASDAGLLNGQQIEQLAEASSRQVWAISSRSGSRLQYWRHTEGCGWTPSSHEAFLATDRPDLVTCFYVHGNRLPHAEALSEGWHVYQRLGASLSPEQPLRIVIWSWPSTRVEGPVQDLRLKAFVSEAHAWHLAWLVDQMHPDVPISLIGYSYGARLVSGALHLLGGGHLAGHSLDHRVHPHRAPLRAVLMAGALDSHALTPRGHNARAASQVERILITVNPKDLVLHYYPLLRGLLHTGPPALGYTGFFAHTLGPDSHKVLQWNVARYVGQDHDWQRYLHCPAILTPLRAYVLFEE
jgi:hypothetical protein